MIVAAISLAHAVPVLAATQGLPFIDEFSDDSDLDATPTTAQPDASKQAIPTTSVTGTLSC